MSGSDMAAAPLYDLLTARAAKGGARFHMPGHKGLPIAGHMLGDAAAIDYTELSDTGNLYKDGGPIARAEELAARACGAQSCLFLTGGSSQGILAALAALCPPGGTVLIDRNSHLSVYHAMALCDLRPRYLYPEFIAEFSVTGGLCPDALSRALEENPDTRAVLVTSPTYYGVMLDIEALARVCARCNAALIVDAAHGAHLHFLGIPGAVRQGAAVEINSLHKTLPALGQGAWLLAGAGTDADALRRMSAVFGTTSPSYAVMASMDLARAYMQGQGGCEYRRAIARLDKIKNGVAARGVFSVLESAELGANAAGFDPGRLCLNTGCAGLNGFDAARILEAEHNVICEMADTQNVVFIITCADSDEALSRLDDAVLQLEKRAQGCPAPACAPSECPHAEPLLTPRQALFCKKRSVPLLEAAGRAACENLAPYPPGVPVVAIGERIDKIHLAYLRKKSYNMDREILTADLPE